MMAWLTACVVLMLAVFTEVNSELVYDVSMVNCDRTGMKCAPTSTDTSCDDTKPAECTCSNTYAHVSDNIKHICVTNPEACAADTTTECKNDGVCYNDGGVEKCHCTQGYTGDDCSTRRVDVKCNALSMDVTVAPYGTFIGEITTLANSADDTCKLTAGTAKKFLYTDLNGCGVDKKDPVDAETATKFELEVLIRYDAKIVKKVDQVVLFTCIFNPDDTVAEILIKDSFLSDELDNDKVEESSDILTTKLYKDNLELAGPADYKYNVGETIKIEQELQVPNAGEYTSMKLKSAVVKESETATAENTVTLVDDGCPKDAPVKTGLAANGPPPVKITLELEAFVFLNALTTIEDTLIFVLTYEMCGSATPCAQKTEAECAGNGNRRRRSATSDNEVTFTKRVFVRLGNKTIEEELDGKQVSAVDMDRCLKNPGLQAVVSVMGLLLFALLLALIIVVFVVCRRSNRRGNKFTDDDPSMTSSTQKLDMQIPRPRV